MARVPPAQLAAEAADRALAESGSREGFLPFLEAHVRPRRNVPWSLKGHQFLRAIAEDKSRVLVVEKAAQMGVSTLMVAELIHTCLGGHNAGYFLDTAGRMRKFVQARLDPIINADDELTRQVVEGRFQPDELAPTPRRRRRGGKSADNVLLKHIGPGTAYFLSTQTMGDVKIVDLDSIYMDEVAELDAEKAEFAQDRLLHSDLKLQRWFSQPDISQMDIDDWFQRSTKAYWKIRCGRCRKWISLELSFPDCLFETNGEWLIGCPRCHVKLDPSRGQWVTMHPDRTISGYHLSQLYGPHIEPADLADQWQQAQTRPSRMRRFQISILGNPWAGDRQPITDALLNTRCGDWGISPDGKGHLPHGAAFAGIDVGDLLHLAIARFGDDGAARIVHLEATPEWGAIEKRLRDHQVQLFVIDALPEKTKSKELIRKLGGGAMVYSSGRRTAYAIEDQETDPVHVVTVDRTEMLDQVVDALTSGELMLPKSVLLETELARDHLKRLVKDKQDDGAYRYRRGAIENHYAFAIAHLLLARQGQTALKLAPAGHFDSSEYSGPSDPRDPRRRSESQSLAPTRW